MVVSYVRQQYEKMNVRIYHEIITITEEPTKISIFSKFMTTANWKVYFILMPKSEKKNPKKQAIIELALYEMQTLLFL